MSAEEIKEQATEEQEPKTEQSEEPVIEEAVDSQPEAEVEDGDDSQEPEKAEDGDDTQEPEKAEETKDEKPQSEENAKRSGVKEAAQNPDMMAIEKEQAEESVDAKSDEDAKPSYFVDEDQKHRVEVDILSNKRTGQIVSVSRTGLGIDFKKEFDYLYQEEAWFDFTSPSYEDMSTYRQRCGIYRQEAQSVIIDKLQLRNFLLVWHLKDWSLTDAKSKKKIELKQDDNGSLSDESMKKVYAVQPTIIDVVLTVFEKDVLLA